MTTLGDHLPKPRLQMTWRRPSKSELKRKTALGGDYDWICDYELILPLHESDIRRKRGRDFLAVKLGGTTVCTAATEMTHSPYRDGAHASWDSEALGNLPVFVIGSDGVARIRTKAQPHGWNYEPVAA